MENKMENKMMQELQRLMDEVKWLREEYGTTDNMYKIAYDRFGASKVFVENVTGKRVKVEKWVVSFK